MRRESLYGRGGNRLNVKSPRGVVLAQTHKSRHIKEDGRAAVRNWNESDYRAYDTNWLSEIVIPPFRNIRLVEESADVEGDGALSL